MAADQQTPLKSLYDSMIVIIENLDNEDFLGAVNYNPDDRDSGYRASLKRLGIERTKKTDDVAHYVIYNRYNPVPEGLFSVDPVQLLLEI